MSTTTNLDKDTNGKSVDEKFYKDMIGSLLYLAASRLDIMFSVCFCARFQTSPKESHLHAVKWIIRYVKGILDFGLYYFKYASFDLLGYSDADFAGSKTDRKSTSETCQFLGHSLVSRFRKNKIVLNSLQCRRSIAVELYCAQILWMRQTLQDYGVQFDRTSILCDNTSAINFSKKFYFTFSH